MPRLEDVFDLYTKMVLGMAVVFQMPTVVFFLSKLGLVTPAGGGDEVWGGWDVRIPAYRRTS